MTDRPDGVVRGAIDAIGSAANPPRPYEQLRDVRPVVPERPARRPRTAVIAAAAALVAAATVAVVILRPGGDTERIGVSTDPVGSAPVAPVASATTVAATPAPETTVVLPPASPSIELTAQEGDTADGLADRLCTLAESLAQVNGWPDGPAHALDAGDRVVVPPSSCVWSTPLDEPGGGPRPLDELPVVGDNEAGGIAGALFDEGAPASDLGVAATGLARPDYFDWPAHLTEILPTLTDGTPIVVSFGLNDAQLLADDDGTVIQPETPAWASEYMHRVGAFADTALAAGHPVIWIVASPPVASSDWLRRMSTVADATLAALDGRPGVVTVNSWDVLRGPDGAAAAATARDATGAFVIVRADGRITPAAHRMLADRVWIALRLLGFDVEHPAPSLSRSTGAGDESSAATPTPGTASVTATEYVVQEGDFLFRIAERYRVDLDELVAYNDWPDGANHPLTPGEVIMIPPGFIPPPDGP